MKNVLFFIIPMDIQRQQYTIYIYRERELERDRETRLDYTLKPWYACQSKRRKTRTSSLFNSKTFYINFPLYVIYWPSTECERYILIRSVFIRYWSRHYRSIIYTCICVWLYNIISKLGAVTRIWDASMVLLWFWVSSLCLGGLKMHLYCTLMPACQDSQPRKE